MLPPRPAQPLPRPAQTLAGSSAPSPDCPRPSDTIFPPGMCRRYLPLSLARPGQRSALPGSPVSRGRVLPAPGHPSSPPRVPLGLHCIPAAATPDRVILDLVILCCSRPARLLEAAKSACKALCVLAPLTAAPWLCESSGWVALLHGEPHFSLRALS